MIQKFVFQFVLILILNTIVYSQEQIYTPTGQYLGQKLPNEIPEIFAPSIIYSEEAIHGQITFYPDGKEIYWIFHSPDYAKNPPKIYCSKQIDDYWTKPVIVEFSENYGAINISISPDGRKFYFNSNRPWPSSWGKKPTDNIIETYKIWYVERNNSEWGEPKLLEKNINQNLGGISSTNNGTLFTHGIKRAKIENGHYKSWEELKYPLNLGRILGGHPFVNADEEYLLFNKKWPGKRGYGIFISYHTETDSWTEPINLLERLGAEKGGSQPIVSPDGKYLFYYSRGNFYWVEAKIIESIKSIVLK